MLKLMGGSEDNDLTLGPEEPAILIGTEDILLSRALNRGYARTPFRWPIDFALLNGDSYWVLDEVQLLGDGLATTLQLAALRRKFGVFGETPSCWISATVDPAWMRTVDFRPLAAELQLVRVEAEDKRNNEVHKRLHASKRVQQAPRNCRLPDGAAGFVAEQHRPGTLSLVIANTVPRAREIWSALQSRTDAETLLLHSRFRDEERTRNMDALCRPLSVQGRIVIATQVIEAGIDLDAAFLLTDSAPFASLVQRFGRVNRRGDFTETAIYWVDRPLIVKRKNWDTDEQLRPNENDVVSAPYTHSEVEAAQEVLSKLESAAPAHLPVVSAPAPWTYVLRKPDLVDLFDTTPDLGGNHIDISRFVRSGEETNVYVAWRDWRGGAADEAPAPDMPQVEEQELCPAPMTEFEAFAKNRRVWSWDWVTEKWRRCDKRYPGITIVLHVSQGGYTDESGWSPESKRTVQEAKHGAEASEGLRSDRLAFLSYEQSLKDHTDDVVSELQGLLRAVRHAGATEHETALLSAARKHDWGKAHPVMQKRLQNTTNSNGVLLAKQQKSKAAASYDRAHFRHELASALAMLEDGESDLAAYVAAAHHGKVRVSIRSMPGERDGDRGITRGIREGDALLAADLGDGVQRPPIELSLDSMKLGSGDGGPSWTDRVVRLRDELGPFRLTYLEMLLRIADERASGKAGRNAP